MRHSRYWAVAAFVMLSAGCQKPVQRPALARASERAAQPEREPLRERCHRATAKSIASLEEPIAIDVHVTRRIQAIDSLADEVLGRLETIRKLSRNKLVHRVLDVATDADRKSAEDAGVQAFEIDGASGYAGVVLRYRGKTGVIPHVDPRKVGGIEFWIANKIREVRAQAHGTRYRFGVVTGKDELALEEANLIPRQDPAASIPSVQSILERAFPFYAFEKVDLSVKQDIDPTLEGLIVTQPRVDYGLAELSSIDRYLMRGGKSLVVYASAVTLSPGDASLSATLSWHNLDRLLGGYGIDVGTNAVFDPGASFRIAVALPSGEMGTLVHPGIARVVNDRSDTRRLDSAFLGFFHIDELVFPFPSSIDLARNKQPPDVELRAVARTSDAATLSTGPTVDMSLRSEWPEGRDRAARVVAALVQGKLASAFQAHVRAPTASRVLLISSSLFLTNPFAYAGNPRAGSHGNDQLRLLAEAYARQYLTTMILSVKATLDWMSAGEDLLACAQLDATSDEPRSHGRDAAGERGISM